MGRKAVVVGGIHVPALVADTLGCICRAEGDHDRRNGGEV